MTEKRETPESKVIRFEDALHRLRALCDDVSILRAKKVEGMRAIIANVLKGYRIKSATQNPEKKGNNMQDVEILREALQLIESTVPDNVKRGGASPSHVRQKIAAAALAGDRVYLENGVLLFTADPVVHRLNLTEGCSYDDD